MSLVFRSQESCPIEGQFGREHRIMRGFDGHLAEESMGCRVDYHPIANVPS